MAALPYMPLFVADYLADTAHLTTQQHGAYLLLLMNYWQRGGSLPDDDARLSKIARVGPREWGRMRGVICEFFSIADGTWSHSRVDRELARVSAKSLKSKMAAQASVQRRFGERSTSVEPTDTQAQADTKKEEEVGGKPPSFAFFGKVVRLKPRDYAEWKRVYHAILDLEAELGTIDGWWQQQEPDQRKNWFWATRNMLNKRHQKLLEERQGKDRGYDRDVITV